ncbi:MAG: hypothetical protein WCG80_00130 [Spirochaetales bacterium]
MDEYIEFKDKVVLICVNKTYVNLGPLAAAQYQWELGTERLERVKVADYVLAMFRGKVVGVIEVEEWVESNKANFPLKNDHLDGRYGFYGRLVEDHKIVSLYLGKRLPPGFRERGNAHPILLSYD